MKRFSFFKDPPIKSPHIGYRDQAIGIIIIQHKSFQLRSNLLLDITGKT